MTHYLRIITLDVLSTYDKYNLYGTVSTYDISAMAYVMSEAASTDNTATPTTQLSLMNGIIDNYKFASLMDLLSAKAKSYCLFEHIN